MADDTEELDYSSDFLAVVDDEGEEHMFEVLDEIETETGRYIAVVPHYEEAQDMLDSDAELVIMKVLEDEEGEYFEAIDDEDEFHAVSLIFTERLEDEYDILYPEEDEEPHA